jgi:hypothetical protein
VTQIEVYNDGMSEKEKKKGSKEVRIRKVDEWEGSEILKKEGRIERERCQ